MTNYNIIQKIEELSMNALPSLQTSLLDGWILRFSDGYTKRANSVNPFYSSTENIDKKIKKVEQIYQKKNLPVIFKLTSNVSPHDLDNTLEKARYYRDGLTSVQLLALDNIQQVPSKAYLTFQDRLSDQLFAAFCKFNHIDESAQTTIKTMLMSIIPKVCYVMLLSGNNETIACGIGVLEEDYIGLFDIVTNEKFRRKGFGEQLIASILKWGKNNGAKYAYLQVVNDNYPARNLYQKLGFKESYQYWYRIKR
ncbi:GNAT family N-acetyltransferase [Gracilibacillus kekensis]|uniref:Acetyltransferase (GNAT) family protein n=1 Tax=Gracilibacillus kekensis TaxID=1027249 RepID=A0A1M7IZN5_9BACI|nr:GNAT family N-acetyltransferase [Gracilibacillus kekensis]SHM46132.1 Acetyltransferase (GNAT) family protein [Gracilibacillus kekensis]